MTAHNIPDDRPSERRPIAEYVRCECGFYTFRCCVPGCQFPRLASAPTCYGHTVDESDPRHIPTQIDGDGCEP